MNLNWGQTLSLRSRSSALFAGTNATKGSDPKFFNCFPDDPKVRGTSFMAGFA